MLQIFICCFLKWKTEAQGIFLISFTVFSSLKRKFVAFPIVDEEKVIRLQMD
jgi:hypothetical protein